MKWCSNTYEERTRLNNRVYSIVSIIGLTEHKWTEQESGTDFEFSVRSKHDLKRGKLFSYSLSRSKVTGYSKLLRMKSVRQKHKYKFILQKLNWFVIILILKRFVNRFITVFALSGYHSNEMLSFNMLHKHKLSHRSRTTSRLCLLC